MTQSAQTFDLAATTETLIRKYYDAFNRADMDSFFALLDDDVIHDINQGHPEIGKAAFKAFMEHMNRCYREKISDLVILTNTSGERAAAEFIVDGVYIASDSGFPAARNQTYRIPAGTFFAIKAGKICRVTTYYNVNEWIKMISA